jgi:dTDP-4-dehydrorhamnose 3,5-epimerase
MAFGHWNHWVLNRGAISGLHFSYGPHRQEKLITVTRGCVFDVVADVRVGSRTFGAWSSYRLSAEGAEALYVPAGVAHGWISLTDEAHISYLCTRGFWEEYEGTLNVYDETLAVEWPSVDESGHSLPHAVGKNALTAPSLTTLFSEGLLPHVDE